MFKSGLENSPFWWSRPDWVSSPAVATIIDGRQVAADVRRQVAVDAAALRERTGHVAGLVTILVGEDPASQVYVRNKIRACEEAGMASFHEPMDASSTQDQVLAMVERYNADDRVDGILVQSPLPAGLDFKQVLERIDPAKDVDGFHPLNVGRLVAGQPGLVRMHARRRDGAPRQHRDRARGRRCGGGRTLGHRRQAGGAASAAPQNATVTVCHSRTRDLPAVTRRADVLVAAVGRPRMITADMVKPGATVIDVGINRTADGLAGDVDFEGVSAVAGAITPVPGGVGPMTIAMLMKNTVTAATARLSG